jgi:hypothetical protein
MHRNKEKNLVFHVQNFSMSESEVVCKHQSEASPALSAVLQE